MIFHSLSNLQQPVPLKPGDTIAAITTAWGGPAVFPERYREGLRRLKDIFGLRVIEMPHTRQSPEWLKQHPEARAHDLMQAFSDPAIKGIIATIGGDDTLDILPYIDFDIINRNPKVVLGFSDTTVLHFLCLRAGLASFYGPSILCEFAENVEMFEYTVVSIQQTLFSCEPIGEIKASNTWTDEYLDWQFPQNQHIIRLRQPSEAFRVIQGFGVHNGFLIGGCLETLAQCVDSGIWPELHFWQDAFLFIELSELKPSPPMVKTLLKKLAEKNIFTAIQGILFGHPGSFSDNKTTHDYHHILKEITAEAGRDTLPIMVNMNFGHTSPSFIIPYGASAMMNCEEHSFFIETSGCSPNFFANELSLDFLSRHALNKHLNKKIALTKFHQNCLPHYPIASRLFQDVFPNGRKVQMMKLLEALSKHQWEKGQQLFIDFQHSGGIFSHEKELALVLSKYAFYNPATPPDLSKLLAYELKKTFPDMRESNHASTLS